MSEFKQYRRSQIAELRPVTQTDITYFANWGRIPIDYDGTDLGDINSVSISDEDLQNDSPKIGDMIARNPKNHNDKWLVAEKFFKDNFEIIHDNSYQKYLELQDKDGRKAV